MYVTDCYCLQVTMLLDMCCHDDNTLPSITPEFLFPIAMVTALLAHPLPKSLNRKISICLVSMVSSVMLFCVFVSNLCSGLYIYLIVHRKIFLHLYVMQLQH